MILLAGAAALIAGCADSTASRADAPPYVAPAWEAVFLPAETAAASDAALASGSDFEAWETRNDHRLSVRTDRSTLASDDWPDTSRPTLERARYIYLQRQPESILYLRRVRDRGRGSHD